MTKLIAWRTALAGATREGDRYQLSVEHYLDQRAVNNFGAKLRMWAQNQDEDTVTEYELTPWKALPPEANSSPRQEMGKLRLFGERLLSLDPQELARDLTAMAQSAHEYVEEQRAWEAERLQPFLNTLHQQ